MLERGGVNGLQYFRVMYQVPFFTLERQHQSILAQLELAYRKILQSGRFILDNEVKAFEEELAAYQKIKYCVAVGNGHDALFISLKALGVGRGDEVLVPSHTCHATWLAVANTGAKPVPVEVDPSTYTVHPTLLANSVTKKTKAIVPVHLYGHPCLMDEIMTTAKACKLLVIEDNAQAHGAIFKNKATGSWGHCNATSFYPTKNLGALGDGGAIFTNDRKLFNFAKAFGNYGSEKRDVENILGINSRLDELQAAVLRIKLKKLDGWNEARRQNANLLFDLIKNLNDIQLPPSESKWVKPVFHQFVIRTRYRDRLRKHLAEKGIETAIHYPTPIHLQKAYAYLGYKKGSLPVAENLSQTVLSLPIWPGLTVNEIEKVGAAIKNFFSGAISYL